MKIKSIDIFNCELKLKKVFITSLGPIQSSRHIFIRVVLEDGTYGWGECAPSNTINGENIKTIICDIRKTEDLERVFIENKIDILIHCAAEILDEKDPNEVWKTNFNGTKNLLNFSEKYNIKKFIFTSTFSIFEKNYDSPIDEKEPSSAIVDYGKSKYAAENLILSHTFSGDITIFRCPVVIGKKRLDKFFALSL